MLYNLRLCQLAHQLGPINDYEESCRRLVLESTFATLTNVNFDDERFQDYLKNAAALVSNMENALTKRSGVNAPPAPSALPKELPKEKKKLLLAAGPAGLLARSAQVSNDDLFGVVEMCTYGLKGVAAYLFHAEELKQSKAAYSEADRTEVYQEFFRIGSYLAQAGSSPGQSEGALDRALSECLAVGALNLKVMGMLDAAHCSALGTPSPTVVPTTCIESEPAILVSGHDLGVLHELLLQTQGRGIGVYTHGEMLPAHGYPRLREFQHLRGHFGTHWGNQLHEFKHFPGAILMTSNCLRPPTQKYKDRLWTSGPVGFHSVAPISDNNFTPLIEKALSLPPIEKRSSTLATRGSSQLSSLLVGFGHGAILNVADQVVSAIKSKQLKNIFVIGGCDGTESTRSYYTDLAAETPQESIILTLGCGKFRLNGEDHGTVAGLPRLIDVGQCNDAYSAIIVAMKLAEALECDVHDLPLHFAVSWFEQKAVAVLLTLLHLELKNIRVGPALPAFITPNVLEVLNTKFGLQGISAGHEDSDMSAMLQGQ